MRKNKKKIVIVGGGFGGVYTAKHLEKLFKHHKDEYEIILISKENYFTYQPMLAEIVGGSLGILDSINSLRSLLPKTTIYVREVTDINVENQTLTLSPNFNHTDVIISYDYLVLALGNVTDFRNSPSGIAEHALPFKNLRDAIVLRNHVIDVLETASTETSKEQRKNLLTFVISGGGFSGVEIAAEINDLVRRKIRKKYRKIDPKEISVYMIHSKNRLVDRELSPPLGEYCSKLLKKRGVKILYGKKLQSATPHEAILNDGTRIRTATIIATAPQAANPLIEILPVKKEKEKVVTDHTLKIHDHSNIFAVGDCALIPLPNNLGSAPPTAQFATREAKCAAYNIFAATQKKPMRAFSHRSLGVMAALGHRRAVAQMIWGIKFSGVLAWIIWRAIYWMKLPGIQRKLKVMLSWFIEAWIEADMVQLKTEIHEGIKHLHYETDEVIFHEGDIGDYLYVIVSGEVEVITKKMNGKKSIAVLHPGEYFGEMALLNQKKRNATILCKKPTDVIAIRKNDFQILVTNFGTFKQDFLRTQEERIKKSHPSSYDIHHHEEDTGS